MLGKTLPPFRLFPPSLPPSLPPSFLHLLHGAPRWLCRELSVLSSSPLRCLRGTGSGQTGEGEGGGLPCGCRKG